MRNHLSSPAGALGPQVAFGTGQIAGQVFRDIPSLLLLFFMTNALGVPPALAGVAIFVPKLIFGVACDVGIGILCDRIAARVHRSWWLLLGAAVAPGAMMLVFAAPLGRPLVSAAYVASTFAVYMLAFACLSVPYLAIASEWSADPRQRVVVMAWRLVFTAVGVLVAGSLAPMFLQAHGGGVPAYRAMSRILAVVCTISLVIAYFGARTAAAQMPARARTLPALSWHGAAQALAQPRFAVLVVAYMIQLTGTGMSYASLLYFFLYGLHRTDALHEAGIITLLACAGIVAAQPAWVALAARHGKKRIYVAASIFYALVALGWGALGWIGPGVSYGFGVLLGLSSSGCTLMGFSLLADIAGTESGGLYASVWIAADKIGFALGGTLLTGLLLWAFGFDAARALAGGAQPLSAVAGIMVAFSVLPGLASLAAAALYARWGYAPPATG